MSPEAAVDPCSGSRDVLHSPGQGTWFEALEILAQDGNKFQVSWVGVDPSTGKGWEPTWVCLSVYETDYRNGKRIAPRLYSIPGK
jgi:hypothetical protein